MVGMPCDCANVPDNSICHRIPTRQTKETLVSGIQRRIAALTRTHTALILPKLKLPRPISLRQTHTRSIIRSELVNKVSEYLLDIRFAKQNFSIMLGLRIY